MAPRTQKALIVTEVGKPLTLTTHWPVPQPGAKQVQIRVIVAGPNPHDQKARDTGLFIAENLPAVLGKDVVGQIVAVGSGVTGFSVGDKVFGEAGFLPGYTQNGFQEYAVLAGFERIVVVGGDETELKSYGATHVIDRHRTPYETVSRIRETVGDDLLYAYDAVNPPATQIIGINALSSTRKGKAARLLRAGPIDESQVGKKSAGYELLDVLGSSHLHAELCKSFWEQVPRLLREGQIKPSAYKRVNGWDAEEVNGVLDAYRDGKKITKTHFHIWNGKGL
ncbi:chaperonin 10-like protein [Aspergillus floccosus]